MRRVVLLLVAAMMIQPLFAAEDAAAFKSALKTIMPGAEPDSIRPSVLPGYYETVYGSEVLYVSEDGRYVFQGNVFDMRQRVNLTEQSRETGRAKVIAAMDASSMIVFAPEGEAKYTITAFTDVDCSYCRKMHREIQAYNDNGIAIRYAAYPRTGPNTPSYFKAVSVWCAKNKQAALTQAKNGNDPAKVSCDNPVDEHMAAAQQVGISGTPTLILEDGKVLPGYVPADQLLKILDEDAKRG